MSFLSLGIDVGLKKGLHLIALDQQLNIVYKENFKPWEPETFKNLVESLSPQIVCIDAPCKWAPSGQKSRSPERELKKKFGIQCFYTPCEEFAQSGFYDWARRGKEIFESLVAEYAIYGSEKLPQNISCEVFPNATAKLILQHYNQNITGEKIKDRTTALELVGIDPSALSNLDELDASLAAWTGICISQDQFHALGNDEEGYLFIPKL